MSSLRPTSVLESANGLQMPVIGLGTWQFVHSHALTVEVEAALNTALEAGYRHIDTAFLYNNERVIGKVLKEWFEAGKFKREDIFITTKLPMYGNQPEKVKTYLQSQLRNLQLEYVDLYLIHNPVGVVETEAIKRGDHSLLQLDMRTDLLALWKEMEKQVDEGRAKHIGVSNFNPTQIERILAAARIPPANLQIELYLYQQAAAERALCANYGITVTSYATLGSSGVPEHIAGRCRDDPLEDAMVKRIAEAHNKTSGQVLLRHALQLGVAVIPKSCDPGKIHQNIEIFDFELTEAEMSELNSLDRGEAGRRFCVKYFMGHPEFPYPLIDVDVIDLELL